VHILMVRSTRRQVGMLGVSGDDCWIGNSFAVETWSVLGSSMAMAM
jgi:hypothetical protein